MVRSCHSGPTSGHLGVKKTIARISERFMWTGIVKDVNSKGCENHCEFYQ